MNIWQYEIILKYQIAKYFLLMRIKITLSLSLKNFGFSNWWWRSRQKKSWSLSSNVIFTVFFREYYCRTWERPFPMTFFVFNCYFLYIWFYCVCIDNTFIFTNEKSKKNDKIWVFRAPKSVLTFYPQRHRKLLEKSIFPCVSITFSKPVYILFY